MSLEKNPSDLYGEKYWAGRMLSQSDTHVTRGEDNGNYWNTAIFISEVLGTYGGSSALDVGCGRGFLVRHLRNLGFQADGIEYGHWAVENSVCNSKWGDLTEALPAADANYDLVSAIGVITHIGKPALPHALGELRRVTKKFLFTNILTMWHETQAHHKTFMPPSFWKPKIEEAGFRELMEAHPMIQRHGFRNSEWQWCALWERV